MKREEYYRGRNGRKYGICKVISAQAVLDEDIWDLEYSKEMFSVRNC